MQLRLLVAQATAPAPSFAPVREYSRRARLFRAARIAVGFSGGSTPVRRRYPCPGMPRKADARQHGAASATANRGASRKASRPRRPQLRRNHLAAAVVVIVACIAVYGMYGTGPSRTPKDPRPGAKGSDAVAVGSARSSRRPPMAPVFSRQPATPLNGGQPAACATACRSATQANPTAPAGGQQAASAERPRTRPSATTRAAIAAANPQSLSFVAFDLEPLTYAPTGAPTAFTSGELVDSTSAGANRAPEPADPTIYLPRPTGTSTPPVGVRPQLPRESAARRRQEHARSDRADHLAGRHRWIRQVAEPRATFTRRCCSARQRPGQFTPALKDGSARRLPKIIWLAFK